jgi:formylglycine-generating enzyme required for sulfatase activity
MTLEECPTPSADDWRAAVLGGQALLELRIIERQPEQAEAPKNAPRARHWLVGLLAKSGLSARERVEAGNTLGMLGDPRFNPSTCYLPEDEMMGFIYIPEGIFRMGSNPQYDPQSRPDEQPQHTLELPGFYIQRYPVTVAQFSVFVKQSGYTPKYLVYLKRIANHPIVDITWNDALAYCAWLGDWLQADGPKELRSRLTSGWRVSLPSEAEWEKAARGTEGSIYPWGDVFDMDKANIFESRIGDSTPVGCFPDGVSPYGLLDMSGNVWEWTRSLWKYDYPYDPKDIDVTGNQYRVLRGGSFRSEQDHVRCAYCRRNLPNDRHYSLGFRVVITSFFSR